MESRAWRYGLLVALVAVTASSPTVNNLFVQDDQPAIAASSSPFFPNDSKRSRQRTSNVGSGVFNFKSNKQPRNVF